MRSLTAAAFLSRGIKHGYQIKSDGDAKLLVVTAPAPDDGLRGSSTAALANSVTTSAQSLTVRSALGSDR